MVAPYKFRGPGSFLFLLNYANVVNCLPQICQLHRASSLPAAEQADMVSVEGWKIKKLKSFMRILKCETVRVMRTEK